jgi:hypothetical protein
MQHGVHHLDDDEHDDEHDHLDDDEHDHLDDDQHHHVDHDQHHHVDDDEHDHVDHPDLPLSSPGGPADSPRLPRPDSSPDRERS